MPKKPDKAIRLKPDLLRCLGCKKTIKLETANFCPDCGTHFEKIELMQFRNPWKQKRLEALRADKRPVWPTSAQEMTDYDHVYRGEPNIDALISGRQANGIVSRAIQSLAAETNYWKKRAGRESFYVVEAFHGQQKGFRQIYPSRFLPETDEVGCECDSFQQPEDIDMPDDIVEIMWRGENGRFEREIDALEIGHFCAKTRLDNAIGIRVVKVIKLKTEAGVMVGRKVIKRFPAQRLVTFV